MNSHAENKIETLFPEEDKGIPPIAIMNTQIVHKIDLQNPQKDNGIQPVIDMNTTTEITFVPVIPVITAPNSDTSNNNIRVESGDLVENELCVPFPVINMMFSYVKNMMSFNEYIREVLTRMKKDEKTIKKVLLISSLITPDLDNWCSKDADIMAIFVGLVFVVYKGMEKSIEKVMFGIIEGLMEMGNSGETSEGNMKRMMDITMRLKSLLKELDRVPLESKSPTGEWVKFKDNVLLKLKY
jgi:hypothetical protein